MKVYKLSNLSTKDIYSLTDRKYLDTEKVEKKVRHILKKVEHKGDAALRELTEELDGIRLDSLRVSQEEFQKSDYSVSEALKNAINVAKENIECFHRECSWQHRKQVDILPGVSCYIEPRPIEKVGLYVPGGTAPLISSALMLTIPALLAGCPQISICSPPDKQGSISPSILYVAKLLGISRVYKVGGAQAIASMAYGTETIPKVYKIFGPGNQYVTMAKQLVAVDKKGTSIDMLSGPTEQLIVADNTARADFIAAEMLSQAEHGPDSQAILATTSRGQADHVKKEIQLQLLNLPRASVAKQALQNSFIVIGDTLADLLSFSNLYAPEHLLIYTENPDSIVPGVVNAGSVFLGEYASESIGDYASGTNHVLPTYGYARAYSGLSVDSFQRMMTVQSVTRDGAALLANTVSTLAKAEGLEAHSRAVTLRTKEKGG